MLSYGLLDIPLHNLALFVLYFMYFTCDTCFFLSSILHKDFSPLRLLQAAFITILLLRFQIHYVRYVVVDVRGIKLIVVVIPPPPHFRQ